MDSYVMLLALIGKEHSSINKGLGYRIAMMYLILTLLVNQAATKYFLTENEEGPVKHHLLKIQAPGNKAEEKEDETRGEGGSK